MEARVRAADAVVADAEGADNTRESRLELARALINEGDAEREARDHEAALRSSERALGILGRESDDDAEVSEVRALACALRATALLGSGRRADALDAETRALERTGGEAATLRRAPAAALAAQTEALRALGRPLEALDDALARLRPHVADPQALALLWPVKPRLLRQTGSLDAALETCQEILTAFADQGRERSRSAALSAQREKAIIRGRSGDFRSARAICEAAIATYRERPEPATREGVTAMMARSRPPAASPSQPCRTSHAGRAQRLLRVGSSRASATLG